LDKNKISETSLILDIIRNNAVFYNPGFIQQKDVFIKNDDREFWKFYIVYSFGTDNVVLYGAQDANESEGNTIDYINLYYYKAGSNLKEKIAGKIKKGYNSQSINFSLIGLRDRLDDFVWKINFLFSKLFVDKNLTSGYRLKEDTIKYINQVSNMKYVYCDAKKYLSKKNMEYMNEIYKKVRKDK